jgi:hypothetical protein
VRGRGITVMLVACAMTFATPSLTGATMDLTASIRAQLKTAAYHAGELAYGSVITPGMRTPKVPEDFEQLRVAGELQRGGAIVATHLHLQHTINCLEGPSGQNFRRSSAYPCEGQGGGIIPDLKLAVARGVPGSRAALDDATIAWKLAIRARQMSDINEAQPWAGVIARYLQKARSGLGGQD